MTCKIDPVTQIGVVALSVADLERSLGYYQHTIGLAVLTRSGDSATLGVGTTPLLCLHAFPGARVVRRATGLYLADSDGHGIEIYRDRPRNMWYDAARAGVGGARPVTQPRAAPAQRVR